MEEALRGIIKALAPPPGKSWQLLETQHLMHELSLREIRELIPLRDVEAKCMEYLAVLEPHCPNLFRDLGNEQLEADYWTAVNRFYEWFDEAEMYDRLLALGH